MSYHIVRNTFYILLCVCGSFATAGENLESANTSEMPSGILLQLQGGHSSPCLDSLPNSAVDLLDVVNLALCNNPQTREVWASTRAQIAQVEVSKAGYFPAINLNASVNRSKTENLPSEDRRSAGVTLSYLLYDFGSRSANLENARQILAATQAVQTSTIQSVLLGAAQAFYQVQATLASLDAAIESEQVARESLAAAQARYDAGSATRADILQAQTAYSQATLNRISTDGKLKNEQGGLANVIGLDANRKVLLIPANVAAIPADFEGNVAEMIEEARRMRPDYQAMAAQVKAAEASVDIARSSGQPTVSLSAASNQINSSGINSNSSQLGINLNIPIFSGYSPTYRTQAAEAQVEAKAAQMESLRLQISLDVWTAYQNLATATQTIRTTADFLDSAKHSERVVIGRYKAGIGSILDVLSAQSTLANAQQQRVQSLFNWNISRTILAQSMGNLDIDLLNILMPKSRTN